MRVLDLGPPRVVVDGVERACAGAKQTSILALLAMRAGERVPLDEIVVAAWGYDATATSSSVENHMWRLRRLLEPGRRAGGSCLVNDQGGYRLMVPRDAVDSRRFERIAAEAGEVGDPTAAVRLADEALALWRGPPYEAIAHVTATEAATARLGELRGQLVERRLEALLQVGDVARVLVDVEPLLAAFPFRERLWAARMSALARAGRTEEALATFRRVRALLRDELGLEPGAELQELHRTVIAQDTPALARGEVHLPGRGGRLIGRDRERHELGTLVGTRRLTTVTGAGGCGKTRLAVEVARERADGFPDGVWFVDLTEAGAPEQVADLAVSRLGLRADRSGTRTALRSSLRGQRLLLVLDNCEHVLDGAAALAEDVLVDGARATVLATSREPLDVDGETVWPLAPLSLRPGPDGRSPAAELFHARAGGGDLPLVERICTGVDGLPLAVELAAARARSFSLGEIVEQVERDPGGLGRVGRGPSDHRRTVRSAVEWSHRLLEPDERLVHRRLAVLPGPFRLPEASAVVGPDVDVAEVPTVLARLVHRSLLVATRRAGQPTQFRQLATVRAHARHHLDATGEREATVARRDRWVSGLLARRPRLGRPEEAAWFDTVEQAYPTVRAALEQVLAGPPDPERVRQGATLAWFWYYRSRVHEGERWLARAVDQVGDGPATAIARLALATLRMIEGRLDDGRAVLAGALADVDAVPGEHRAQLVEAMVGAAGGAWTQRAFDLVGTVCDRLPETDDPDLEVVTAAIRCVPALADTAALDELAARTVLVHDRAVACDNSCARWMTCGVLNILALFTRDADAGLLWCPRLMEASFPSGTGGAAVYVASLGDYLVMRGDLVEAVRLFSWAHTRARRTGMPWPPRPTTQEFLDAAAAGLTADEHARAWAEGARLRLDDVMDRYPARGSGVRAPRGTVVPT
ncbi:BTAD domain-containing putative transcriptional regulator [Pseudonocardia sp.]|uniref:BTAD domain-containing putative transcriptional regulator n=1 Tax=Pseudonocardia sp. TaxID=60912 RepID=UPI003D0F6000